MQLGISYMYQMYKDTDVPTVQSLLVKLKEKCLPFDISIASLTRLLHKIGFTYKLLNRRTSIWSQLKHKIRKVNNTTNLDESIIRATREFVDEIDSVLWSACIRIGDSLRDEEDLFYFVIISIEVLLRFKFRGKS
jgi:hypothetical protein